MTTYVSPVVFDADSIASLQTTFLSPVQHSLHVLQVDVCSCIEDPERARH